MLSLEAVPDVIPGGGYIDCRGVAGVRSRFTQLVVVALAFSLVGGAEKATTQQSTAAPSISIEFLSSPADEADEAPFLLRITRHGDASKELEVWITTGGTMTAGEDYYPPPKSITMCAGQTTYYLAFQGIDDDIAEGRETLEVSVSLAPPATQPTSKP